MSAMVNDDTSASPEMQICCQWKNLAMSANVEKTTR
jgi:hypothetical protein